MEEIKNEIWHIMSAAINGTADENENKSLLLWLSENDENRRIYDILKAVTTKKRTDLSEIKSTVLSKIQKEVIYSVYRRKIRILSFATAASVAVLMVLGSVLYFQKHDIKEQTLTIETSCPLGTKSKIVLPDGSLVFLNSGSRLLYPTKFYGKERKVRLSGEGYFEVMKDSKHPFIVNSGQINIKVFGTRFNLKNYENDQNIEATLIEGSVGLYETQDINYSKKVSLAPNEQISYDKKNGRIIRKNVDAELTAMWKDGKYYFDQESFSAIAKKLERNFNVNFIIESKQLKEMVFSGLFDRNRTIYQILDAMRRHHNFKYVIEKDTIRIK